MMMMYSMPISDTATIFSVAESLVRPHMAAISNFGSKCSRRFYEGSMCFFLKPVRFCISYNYVGSRHLFALVNKIIALAFNVVSRIVESISIVLEIQVFNSRVLGELNICHPGTN